MSLSNDKNRREGRPSLRLLWDLASVLPPPVMPFFLCAVWRAPEFSNHSSFSHSFVSKPALPSIPRKKKPHTEKYCYDKIQHRPFTTKKHLRLFFQSRATYTFLPPYSIISMAEPLQEAYNISPDIVPCNFRETFVTSMLMWRFPNFVWMSRAFWISLLEFCLVFRTTLFNLHVSAVNICPRFSLR